MIIRHHLATGFNEIPIKNVRYATEHTEKAGVVEHTGWKVMGEYAGDNTRQQKHKYEIIFTPDEAREHLQRLTDMVARFDGEEHIRMLIENHDTVDMDGDDDG